MHLGWRQDGVLDVGERGQCDLDARGARDGPVPHRCREHARQQRVDDPHGRRREVQALHPALDVRGPYVADGEPTQHGVDVEPERSLDELLGAPAVQLRLAVPGAVDADRLPAQLRVDVLPARQVGRALCVELLRLGLLRRQDRRQPRRAHAPPLPTAVPLRRHPLPARPGPAQVPEVIDRHRRLRASVAPEAAAASSCPARRRTPSGASPRTSRLRRPPSVARSSLVT